MLKVVWERGKDKEGLDSVAVFSCLKILTALKSLPLYLPAAVLSCRLRGL